MIKKTITYTDFNGDERTEDHYFHLSKAEITEMEVSYEKGLTDHIEKIVEAEDSAEIIEVFKLLIRKSYGVRSEDGRRFIKKKEDLEEFMSTGAYSELFMEVGFDAEAAAQFINGVMPKGL